MTGRTVQQVTDRYRHFAEVEAVDISPRYAAFAAGIAADPDVLAFLANLPAAKQQPNLLLAAVQYLHGTATGYAEWRRWLLQDAGPVRATMLTRATQTNEPARCAALLRLRRHRVGGPSPVTLRCAPSGPGPLPDRLPEVAARTGVDLHPLDPADPDDRAWLRALVWPGQHDRLSRLDAALDLAAAEPVRMLTGHLLDQLPAAVAAAPAGGTVVVFHTAVLVYLGDDDRAAFTALVGELPVRWISQEGVDVLPAVRELLPAGEPERPALRPRPGRPARRPDRAARR